MNRENFPEGHKINRDNYKQFKYEPDEIIFRPRRKTASFEVRPISLDKRCKQRLASGESFMITNPDSTNTKKEKTAGGIHSPKFGPDMFNPDIREYSCPKGCTVGAINEGKVCITCGGVVKFVAANMDKEAYIDIAPYHVLTYHGWNAMSKEVKNFKNVLKNKNKHSIDRSGKLIVSGDINLLTLYDDYDELYADKTGMPKSIAFTSKIPVISANLRPLVRSGSKMTVFPINKTYENLVKLADNLEIMVLMDNVENDLPKIRIITEIQECFTELWGEFELAVRGKTGLFKKYISSSRLDYTCRAVIASDPFLKLHEVIVPYQTMLELFEEELVSFIMQMKKINLTQAYDFFMRSRNHINKDMLAIINIYLKTQESWVIIDRNPTIKYGGILYMKIKGCHKNLKNKTMLLPHGILVLQNADFDGDQETITAQKLAVDSPYSYHNLFKLVFCPIYMIIDKATGRFNRCMAPKKDKLAMLYEIYDISKMLTHINSIETKTWDTKDPYVAKYNRIMECHDNTSPNEDSTEWLDIYDEASEKSKSMEDYIYSGDDVIDLDLEDYDGE